MARLMTCPIVSTLPHAVHQEQKGSWALTGGTCGTDAQAGVLTWRQTAQAMFEAKFWGEGDVGLMTAWVSDLQAVGYKFPSVRSQPKPPALQAVDWQAPTPEHWCGALFPPLPIVSWNLMSDGAWRGRYPFSGQHTRCQSHTCRVHMAIHPACL